MPVKKSTVTKTPNELTNVSNFAIFALGMVHVYVRPDGLASVIISDNEYPQRAAHTLLSKVKTMFISI